MNRACGTSHAFCAYRRATSDIFHSRMISVCGRFRRFCRWFLRFVARSALPQAVEGLSLAPQAVPAWFSWLLFHANKFERAILYTSIFYNFCLQLYCRLISIAKKVRTFLLPSYLLVTLRRIIAVINNLLYNLNDILMKRVMICWQKRNCRNAPWRRRCS